MVKTLEVESTNCLQLNDELVKEIYKQVDKLADFKYRVPIETLKTRHKTYEPEDFVQDTVKLVIQAFKTKTFKTLSNLKGFINTTMEFHYLKEKRKYFYTHRGDAFVSSFDDPVTDFMTVGDTITYDYKPNYDNFELHNIMSKNLYVVFDWQTYKVCRLNELKKFKKGIAISVNYFIQAQRELGMRDTCRHYKDKGFYMTQNVFEGLSTAIIDYMKEHDLLLVEQSRPKYNPERARAPWLTMEGNK